MTAAIIVRCNFPSSFPGAAVPSLVLKNNSSSDRSHFKNLCPVSNLLCIWKKFQKVAASQLRAHGLQQRLLSHNLSQLQSGFLFVCESIIHSLLCCSDSLFTSISPSLLFTGEMAALQALLLLRFLSHWGASSLPLSLCACSVLWVPLGSSFIVQNHFKTSLDWI